MGLSDGLSNPNKKAAVIDDFVNLIEAQLAAKSGISGIALRTAFGALKGIKPGYIGYVVEQILPESFTAIDPIWSEGVQTGDPAGYLAANSSRTADALLSVTDARVVKSSRQIVKGTYEKLRGSAKQYVEAAVPDLAKVVDNYAKT